MKKLKVIGLGLLLCLIASFTTALLGVTIFASASESSNNPHDAEKMSCQGNVVIVMVKT